MILFLANNRRTRFLPDDTEPFRIHSVPNMFTQNPIVKGFIRCKQDNGCDDTEPFRIHSVPNMFTQNPIVTGFIEAIHLERLLAVHSRSHVFFVASI